MNDSTKPFVFNKGLTYHSTIIGKTKDDMGESQLGSEVGYLEVRTAIISDSSTTYWLRDAMATLEKRDPVDALKDAETLALLAQLRAKEIFGNGM